MTPLEKLTSTAISSKAQALALGVTTVMVTGAPEWVKAVTIGVMVVGYMLARAWEDNHRALPEIETEAQ